MGKQNPTDTSELRAFRKRRKRTLKVQASIFGMTEAHLSRVERGQVPSEAKVRRIYRDTRGRITPNHIYGIQSRRGQGRE